MCVCMYLPFCGGLGLKQGWSTCQSDKSEKVPLIWLINVSLAASGKIFFNLMVDCYRRHGLMYDKAQYGCIIE